jgi:tRNA(adenine34) deaminase
MDSKGGACGSLYNIASDGKTNHTINVVSGILEEECSELLSKFFRNKRNKIQD